MTTEEMIYDIPNLGCLLGMAYQSELSRLSKVLTDEGLGISSAEYLIMRVLISGGKMQQCEITRVLNKDRASISRSIKSLETKGLVDVQQTSYKCCNVSLSEAGMKMVPQILKVAEQRQQKLSDRISPEEINKLREILTKIIQ